MFSGDGNNYDSMIIRLFPSSMSLSNQSIVNRNYIENEDLVSTVDFRVQSTVSWERSINYIIWKGRNRNRFPTFGRYEVEDD